MPCVSMPYVQNGTLFLKNSMLLNLEPQEETVNSYYETTSTRVSVRLPVNCGIIRLVKFTQEIFAYIKSNITWLKDVNFPMPVLRPCEQYIVVNNMPVIWPMPGQASMAATILGILKKTTIRALSDIVLEYIMGRVVGVTNQTLLHDSVMSVYDWKTVEAKIIISKDPWYMQRLYPRLSKLSVNSSIRNLITFPDVQSDPMKRLLAENSIIDFKVSFEDGRPARYNVIRLKKIQGRSFSDVYLACVHKVHRPDIVNWKMPVVELIGARKCVVGLHFKDIEKETLLEHAIVEISRKIFRSITNGEKSVQRTTRISLHFQTLILTLKTRLIATEGLYKHIKQRLMETLDGDEPSVTTMSATRIAPLIHIELHPQEKQILSANLEYIKSVCNFHVQIINFRRKTIIWKRSVEIVLDDSIKNLPFVRTNARHRNASALQACISNGVMPWLMATGMGLPVRVTDIGRPLEVFINTVATKTMISLLKTASSCTTTSPFEPDAQFSAWISVHPYELRNALSQVSVKTLRPRMYIDELRDVPLPSWFPTGCLCTGKRIRVNLAQYFTIPYLRLVLFVSLIACSCTECRRAIHCIERERQKCWYVIGNRRIDERSETQAELLSIFANIGNQGNAPGTMSRKKHFLAAERPGGWLARFRVETGSHCSFMKQWLFAPSLYPRYIFMAMELFINMQSVMCAAMPHYELRREMIFDTLAETEDCKDVCMVACEPHGTMSVCFIHTQKGD